MTITPSVEAVGVVGACAIRATRLDASCRWVPGDNNGAIFGAIATLTATPDVEEGTRIEPKDACDKISFTSTGPDITKRYTVAFELNLWDFAAVELLTDATAILGGPDSPWPTKIIGIERAGSQSPASNGIALEVWSKTAVGDGACGDVSDVPPWMRHVFPRLYLRTDDVTLANDAVTCKLTGWGAANRNWGTGPWDGWPAASGLGENTPFASLYDTDIPAIGLGYVTVPSIASA